MDPNRHKAVAANFTDNSFESMSSEPLGLQLYMAHSTSSEQEG
ncbi:hypothetical protein SOVF_091240 [Spinacia oleracea]|nr:hypothetical protein SOVF_091240 [Spinacia oleracea]